PGSAVLALAEQWPRASWRMPASTCLELPSGDIGTLLARLPGRTAGKVRAKLRRIEASGIAVTPVPSIDAEAGVDRLMELHLRQWQDRPVNQEHTRPRFRRHLASALTELIRDGEAALFEYHCDNELVASDMVLIGRDVVGAYLYGAVPELRDKVDVTLLLLRQDLGVAARAGVPTLSMLRGDEPYKRKWRPDPVANKRLILGRNPAAFTYAITARCRAALSTRKHQLQRASDG
ncbi:GNAT family N-acetyltransferase, partial [Actinomadura adrarensis]